MTWMFQRLIPLFRVLSASLLNPNGKSAFIFGLPSSSKILDVGCGNNSPKRVKDIKPNSSYTGLDVGDYNQSTTSISYADQYIISTPDDFHQAINNLPEHYDGIICSHNLEHCLNPYDVVHSMSHKCRIGGRIYISFPSASSLNFPSRGGVLNYYDDGSHNQSPPSPTEVKRILVQNNMRIVRFIPRNQPIILRLLGNIVEGISKKRNKVMLGTWAKYGFETVIIAQKIDHVD